MTENQCQNPPFNTAGPNAAKMKNAGGTDAVNINKLGVGKSRRAFKPTGQNSTSTWQTWLPLSTESNTAKYQVVLWIKTEKWLNGNLIKWILIGKDVNRIIDFPRWTFLIYVVKIAFSYVFTYYINQPYFALNCPFVSKQA